MSCARASSTAFARGPEVVRARQRAQERGERRRVVEIVACGEHLEQRLAPAVPRAAEAERALARDGRDRVLGLDDLFVELLARVEVQPRLVLERVVAHLVPARDERRQRGGVALDRRVEADDEEGDAQSDLFERIERHRQERRQVRRTLDPLGRRGSSCTTRDCRRRARCCRVDAQTCAAAGSRVSRSGLSTAAWRFARPTVSLTLSVPLAICAELTMKTLASDVRRAGSVVSL